MRVIRTALCVALAHCACAGIQLAAAAEGASAASNTPQDAPQVMMLGVFHFANPGLDLVKSGVIDVMNPPNQAYLEKLTARIAEFRPTDVLIECEPSAQTRFDADYVKYVAGTFEATSNENHQLGFRAAKEAGLSRVTCFDEADVGWEGEPLMAYIKAHEPNVQKALDATIEALSAREDREQATLSLAQLLLLSNDPARDRENKAFYLATNAVDAGASFVGADAAASWWHRNFRMYANVQRAATSGRRVLVIAGAGHTAILKDLLAIDSERIAIDVRPLLGP